MPARIARTMGALKRMGFSLMASEPFGVNPVAVGLLERCCGNWRCFALVNVVAMARRGWVRRGEVLNALPEDAFRRAVRPGAAA